MGLLMNEKCNVNRYLKQSPCALMLNFFCGSAQQYRSSHVPQQNVLTSEIAQKPNGLFSPLLVVWNRHVLAEQSK